MQKVTDEQPGDQQPKQPTKIPPFMPQQQIEFINNNTFTDWKRQTNGNAACAAVMIGVGQNKNAGQLLLLSAQGVEISYAINILRSCADQMEKQLPPKVKEQNDLVVKRLSWHRRLWNKIMPPKIKSVPGNELNN